MSHKTLLERLGELEINRIAERATTEGESVYDACERAVRLTVEALSAAPDQSGLVGMLQRQQVIAPRPGSTTQYEPYIMLTVSERDRIIQALSEFNRPDSTTGRGE